MFEEKSTENCSAREPPVVFSEKLGSLRSTFGWNRASIATSTPSTQPLQQQQKDQEPLANPQRMSAFIERIMQQSVIPSVKDFSGKVWLSTASPLLASGKTAVPAFGGFFGFKQEETQSSVESNLKDPERKLSVRTVHLSDDDEEDTHTTDATTFLHFSGSVHSFSSISSVASSGRPESLRSSLLDCDGQDDQDDDPSSDDQSSSDMMLGSIRKVPLARDSSDLEFSESDQPPFPFGSYATSTRSEMTCLSGMQATPSLMSNSNNSIPILPTVEEFEKAQITNNLKKKSFKQRLKAFFKRVIRRRK